MPNIKSAMKRVLVSAKKKDNNTVVKSSMKTAIKDCNKAIIASDKALADEKLKVANKRIDKAVVAGLVHKNKAARLKSKLTKQVISIN